MEGEHIPFKKKAKVLGLSIGTTGMSSHIKNRIAMAQTRANKLKRFRCMKAKTKLHLYKSLIRPILDYPPIPICNTAKTNMQKIQRVQSKTLRTIFREQDVRPTNEQLHIWARMEPKNQRIHNLSTKIWDTLERQDPEIITASRELDEYPGHEHKWWPRTSLKMQGPSPDPIYI